MATYGSASNPVTTLTGTDFVDTPNTVYCYIGQTTTFSNCVMNGYIPAVGVASQSGVSNVSFSSGSPWTLSFTLTSSTGSIKLQGLQGFSCTFNLIGVQLGPTPGGSGTQADPWTSIDCTFDDLASSSMFGTWYPSSSLYRYVQNGASFRIKDNSYGVFEYGLSRTNPSYTVYGLAYEYVSSIGTWALHGNITGQAGDTLRVYFIEMNWDSEEEVEYGPYTFVLVGNPPATGPTLNVKVSGAWKSGKPYVKVNGAWKEATKVYVKVNGAWKESQ